MVPLQNPPQVRFTFMFAVRACWSHALPGSWPRACSMTLLSSKNPVRAACVLPGPPKPGVTQSVPALTPKSRSPTDAWLIAPQLSLMRT